MDYYLTKHDFWDEIELKYPKAIARFKEWINKYKSELNWDDLFNAGFEVDFPTDIPATTAPKYHELPVAMQFGIFMEYFKEIYQKDKFDLDKIGTNLLFILMNNGPGNAIGYLLSYIENND